MGAATSCLLAPQMLTAAAALALPFAVALHPGQWHHAGCSANKLAKSADLKPLTTTVLQAFAQVALAHMLLTVQPGQDEQLPGSMTEEDAADLLSPGSCLQVSLNGCDLPLHKQFASLSLLRQPQHASTALDPRCSIIFSAVCHALQHHLAAACVSECPHKCKSRSLRRYTTCALNQTCCDQAYELPHSCHKLLPPELAYLAGCGQHLWVLPIPAGAAEHPSSQPAASLQPRTPRQQAEMPEATAQDVSQQHVQPESPGQHVPHCAAECASQQQLGPQLDIPQQQAAVPVDAVKLPSQQSTIISTPETPLRQAAVQQAACARAVVRP